MSVVSALAFRELTPPAVPGRALDVAGAFERLRDSEMPWLLDSQGAGSQRARFSFMGADPYLVVRARGRQCEFETRRAVVPGHALGSRHCTGDPVALAFDAVPRVAPASVEGVAAAASPFVAGAVGYLGYELAECCEPVSLEARDDFGLPDLVFLYNDRIAVFDHREGCAYAVGLGFAADEDHALAEQRAQQAARELAERLGTAAGSAAGDEPRTPPPATRWVLERELPPGAVESLGAERYAAAVDRIRDEIGRGRVYQANLTQRIDLEKTGAGEALGWRLHRALREINPAPFAAYLSLPEVEICSSSPERFLRLDADRRVESRPIKGTRRRGASREEDALLAKELEVSSKDRAENLMIVDLVRNDLGRVCETGSVSVPDLRVIEPYATVHQMVSTVCGRLRADRDRADLVRATFPPGSMTGAPKIAAMETIDRIEPVRRGIYSGAIGYLDVRGGLDLSVVIRTLLVRDGAVHTHAGGAVVSDSDPEAEYREAIDKVRALLAAVASAE